MGLFAVAGIKQITHKKQITKKTSKNEKRKRILHFSGSGSLHPTK